MKKYLYEDLYRLEETHWWHISKQKVVEALIVKYNKVKSPKILDIGCGTGKNMENLQKLGTTYGLDNSVDALSFCRKRGLKNLILANSENTHLSKNSFDIVTLLDLLEHTNEEDTLKEVNRVLRKDGLLIISVPAFQWLWSKWDEVLHHRKRYTEGNLKQNLISHTFQPIKSTYLYAFLVLPILITRRIKERIFETNYPSDFQLSNPMINFILLSLSQMEFFISNFIKIPFGTSIFVVARKI